MCVQLAPRLGEIIRASAPKWEARDVAPTTPAQLGGYGVLCARMPVWAGASAGTIHGDPATNWAFRAWHDATHVATGLGFDVAAEVEMGRIQACEVARLSGDKLATIVWLEIAGQALEYQRTGHFVIDQVAWTVAQLTKMGVSA